MSSVHRALSQVAPLKRYVSTADNAQLYKLNALGAVVTGPTVASAGTVLRDMGKTKYSADGATTLRKVQAFPISSGVIGYIKLGDASVAGQSIVALN